MRCLEGFASIFALAQGRPLNGDGLPGLIQGRRERASPRLRSHLPRPQWRILPAIEFAGKPARCHDLGHRADPFRQRGQTPDDARQRRADRAHRQHADVPRRGGRRPAPGEVGIAPEWFYKGGGTILRGHGEPLDVPRFAEDGGEEAEIAGVYVIGADGKPCRIGLAAGQRVLRSPVREAELPQPRRLEAAHVRDRAGAGADPGLRRRARARCGSSGAGADLDEAIASGETEMCHSLRNIEHHHFKFDAHRRPGDVHVHFFGAHSLSFGEGVTLEDGDVMGIRFDGFGRPLRNTVRVEPAGDRPVDVRPPAEC